MPDELLSDLELAGIRADTTQLFVDEGTVHRPDPNNDADFDPDTGAITDQTETLIYTGVMSIYPIESRRDRFDEFGQGLIFTRQYRVILPWDTPKFQIRDVVRATVSDDPKLIGRRMEVRDTFVSTILGYRRLTVHDIRE